MSNGILISLAGRARVGKGSFVTILDDIMCERRPSRNVIEVAFATCLKQEVDPITRAKYGISAFTTDNEEKKVIRPDLVERGAGARVEDPNHWIKLAEPQVKQALDKGDVVIVSDSRYRNECNWIHSLGGKVIYIERIQPDGTPVPPANDEEARNDDAAREVADTTVSWPTFEGTLEERHDKMVPFVLEAWNQVTQAA